MERLNPFLKGVSILLCGLVLSFGYSALLNCCIISLCLFLLVFCSHARLSKCLKGLLPVVLAAVSIYYTGLRFTGNTIEIWEVDWFITVIQNGNASYPAAAVYNGIQMSTRVLAFASLGALFALTTDGEEFVMSLMHQCRLKPKYAYGVLAAFHLLPLLQEELEKTRLAYKVRGITVRWYSVKPLFSMLVNTIHWSESVAMAMEAKGFDGEGKRTFYRITHLRWFDWSFFAGTIGFIAIGFYIFHI